MALSKIDVANMVTGATPVANGGTGLTSGTTNQFLKFTGSTTLASAADNTGKLNQIIFAETTSATSQTGTSYADTNLTASITPSATDSKILLTITDHVFMHHTNSHDDMGGAFRVKRTIGGSNTTLYQNANAFEGWYASDRNGVTDKHYINTITWHYLDTSHSTTSAITYRHQIAAYRGNDNARIESSYNSQRANMTLMEVLA